MSKDTNLIRIGGAPTDQGGLDYFWDKERKLIIEKGAPERYGGAIYTYSEIDPYFLAEDDWLIKALKEYDIDIPAYPSKFGEFSWQKDEQDNKRINHSPYDEFLTKVVNRYKIRNNIDEPMDGDDVDNLVNELKNRINQYEGNI
jgi:hypothetical protein